MNTRISRGTPVVRNVRADELSLNSVILLADVLDSTVRPIRVVSLSIVGDDVEVNDGLLTTSVGNLLTVLP